MRSLHMNNETVKAHAEAMRVAMRTQHGLTHEQVRRICTEIVRLEGSLKHCKELDTAELTAE